MNIRSLKLPVSSLVFPGGQSHHTFHCLEQVWKRWPRHPCAAAAVTLENTEASPFPSLLLSKSETSFQTVLRRWPPQHLKAGMLVWHITPALPNPGQFRMLVWWGLDKATTDFFHCLPVTTHAKKQTARTGTSQGTARLLLCAISEGPSWLVSVGEGSQRCCVCSGLTGLIACCPQDTLGRALAEGDRVTRE